MAAPCGRQPTTRWSPPRYVLGTRGWRAEWVVIRELMAPDTRDGARADHAEHGTYRYNERADWTGADSSGTGRRSEPSTRSNGRRRWDRVRPVRRRQPK